MIHRTAIIGSGAKIGANVEIGPHSIIGGAVTIADDCVIGANVVIEGKYPSAEAIESGTARLSEVPARCSLFGQHEAGSKSAMKI
mgnify:CR=1 FL=1